MTPEIGDLYIVSSVMGELHITSDKSSYVVLKLLSYSTILTESKTLSMKKRSHMRPLFNITKIEFGFIKLIYEINILTLIFYVWCLVYVLVTFE